MGFKETGCKSMDWIHMAQDRIQWWDLVKTVMNFRCSQKEGIIST